MHPKPRRNNNMNGGSRHHNNNNRPRRFNNNGGGGHQGDAANVTRTRRHAMQQREKYQNMARDAMSMGDRVLAENYLQHSDHYHRVILSLPPEEQPRHNPQQRHNQGEEQGASEGYQGQENAEPAAMDNGHQPMPSADALPSFITQQNMGNHPPQNFEE